MGAWFKQTKKPRFILAIFSFSQHQICITAFIHELHKIYKNISHVYHHLSFIFLQIHCSCVIAFKLFIRVSENVYSLLETLFVI